MVEVVEAAVADAPQVLALLNQLDTESDFMLLEPGERTTTLEEQRDVLDTFRAAESKAMFLAKAEKDVVGFVLGVGNTNQRNRHSLYCVIGVLKRAAGKGLGKALMRALENWAVERGFTRLELTVMRHNHAAIALYRARGFEVEGTRRHSLRVNGEYVDEYMMAKLLR